MKKYLPAILIGILVAFLGYYLLFTKINIKPSTGINVESSQKISEVNQGNLPPLGQENAPIKVIEFGDYLCPFCGRTALELYPQLENLINQGKLVLYYRDFIVHSQAAAIANAARCANEQGKFWEYNKELFKKFMNNEETKTKQSWLDLAKSLNLDIGKFEKCVDENRYLSDVQNDTQEGYKLGVEGTPTFFINGERVVGADFDKFWSIVNKYLK